LNVCTIVARNYLASARVFAESLTAVHPECRVTVLVVDGPGEPSDRDRFRVLQLEDIIPDEEERRRQTFIYDVTELSTAVKPLLLRYLLSEGAPAVLYFDPDIEFFAPVDHLWQLAAERQIVLTPHVLTPIPDDGYEISDLTVLRAGLFNLGFIGVGAGAGGFLDWWIGRLRRHCVSDPGNGMFVDQRWVDYVAAAFPHEVVRDPGCNVAYWNLHERRVVETESGFTVNGVPLRFYHFSGFNPDVPHLLSKHQGPNPRALLSEHPAVQELCRRYSDRLRAHGHGALAVGYGHSALPDGTPIDFVMRRLFRRALLQAERTNTSTPPAPFSWGRIVDWLNAPAPEAPRLTRYLFGLYQERGDLQRAFPAPFGAQADAYLHWVTYDPWAIETIPASLRPSSPAPAACDVPSAFRTGLNIAGYFKAELGVGEIARLVAAASQREGLPVATVLNDRTLSRQEDAFEESAHDGPYSVTLVCANADEFPRAVDALPPEMRDPCYRIGFWFWETERLPEVYRPSSDLLDEIWVASEYVAAAVQPAVTKPVRICPVPVRQFAPTTMSRADLGAPEGFLFLFMFDFLSSIQRKNPIGLVQAFCRAFRPGEGPTLMLKSINGHLARAAQEALRAAIGDRPDVIAVDGYMASGTRDALMKSCDCYVSLHRSEGFGLTLAEAMTLGKPAIATAYSGNLAFMTPENSFLVPYRRVTVPGGCGPYPEGDWWAEPDLAAAASIMRAVYENPGLARDRGERGRIDVTERYSPARTTAFIRERLVDIQRRRAGEDPAAVVSPEPAPPPAVIEELPPPRPEEVVAPVLDVAAIEALCAQLHLAEREAAEAESMLTGGIPFGTRSRFGWPGQLLRTAVLRMIRPYVHFDARAHRLHLQSTQRIIESLRTGVPLGGIEQRAGDRSPDRDAS
jgi:glycosyltransferase involved in cell wall biosynthesis